MLNDIKNKLITNVDSLIKLLEYFGFEKIALKVSEIRFARDDAGGPNNIQIRLDNNDGIVVKDYARNVKSDIISYIMQEKHVDFKTVLDAIKTILNLGDNWQEQKRISLFGGFYDTIGAKFESSIPTYSDEIMNQYDNLANSLWIKEGIHIETQRAFDVRYDPINDLIIFPWRNDVGQIIAVKGRYNGVPEENMPKYYYPIGGNISSFLYGFSENYAHLDKSKQIFVFEGEKSVMKMYERGYYNCVALGSNSLSPAQATLLIQLQPEEIVFMLDKNLPYEVTYKNAKIIREFSSFLKVKMKMWDWQYNKTLPPKSAPCDGDEKIFTDILNNEIIDIEL